MSKTFDSFNQRESLMANLYTLRLNDIGNFLIIATNLMGYKHRNALECKVPKMDAITFK